MEAIEKGSIEVKASAARALKDLPECEPILLELSKDNKKDIKVASLFSLAYLDTDAGRERIIEMFLSKERDSVIQLAKVYSLKSVTRILLDEGRKRLEEFLKLKRGFSDFTCLRKNSNNDIKIFVTILACIEGKNDPQIIDFLKECSTYSGHLKKFGFYLGRKGKTLAEQVDYNINIIKDRDA